MAQKAGYNGIKKFSDQFNLTTEGSLSLNMQNDPDVGGDLPISGDAAKELTERIEATQQLIDDTVGFESINLLKLTLTQLKSFSQVGTWSGNVLTHRGVTFTFETDSNDVVTNIVINGTASGGRAYLLLSYNAAKNNPFSTTGNYILSSDNNSIDCGFYDTAFISDDGELTIPYNNQASWNFSIGVPNGRQVDNVSAKPMVRKAVYANLKNYVPYHASVDESKVDNTVIAPVENDTTASQAYATNDFFMHNGELYIATTSIAQGATFTEGTNCTKKTIGEVLTALLNA